jgi:MFS transporter, YNFM family, putative membrane transport protein
VVTGTSGATAAEGYLPGSAEYRRVLVALFLAGLATFAVLYSPQAILPELSAQFDVSATSATLTVSLTTLGLGAALLVAGPWSDVTGRTRLIHLSLWASGVVAVASAVAPGWTAVLALRLLQGVVLAGLPAVATAYLREELHPSAQARAAGLYIGGTALGGMAGRLSVGIVADVAGWRWGLATVAALALAAALVVQLLLPASRGFVPAPRDFRQVMRRGREALTDRVLVVLYVVGGCSMGAFVAVFNIVGFRLTGEPFELGLAAASLVYLVYPVGTVSSVVFGRLADRFGRRAVTPVACLIAIAGVLLTLAPSLVVLVVGLALLTAGFFAVHGIASGWVPVRAHAGAVSTGQAASLYLFTLYLGSSVFGSLAGTVWHSTGWPGVVVLAVVLFAVAGGLTLWLRRIPTLLTTPPS